MQIFRHFRAILLLIAAAGLTAYSQSITGTVTGTVTDSSGGAIAGASVTLRSETTGESRSMKSNETGDFVFN